MDRLMKTRLLFAMIVLSGCGQSKPISTVPETVTETASSPAIRETATESRPTTSIPLVSTAKDGTAESTFQQTLIAFQEGRLENVFNFLPPSYQSDVNKLVHDFAGKMDAEIWSSSFDLFVKVANLLKSKKTLILSLDGVKRTPQIESIKPHWDAIATGIHDVASSELADLSKLKQASVHDLLASASKLFRRLPLPPLNDVQVITVKSDATTATLSYRETRDSDPKQVEFVLIEGKWLPKSIVNGWASCLADARTMLEELPLRISVVKPEAMKQIDAVGGMIEQLQSAKTSDEFDAAVAPLIFTLAFGAQMAQQSIKDATNIPRKGNAVHCIINRELNDSQISELKDVVMQMLNTSVADADYELISNNGKTRCRFIPVSDINALTTLVAKHFDAAEVRLDLENRTIHVDLK
jgi:hypothetical protein